MKRFLLAIAAVVIFAWPILLLTGCGSAEQHTRTALDAIAIAAQPAQVAALLACERGTDAITAEVRERGYKEAYDDKAQAYIARCDKTKQAFAAIRKMQDEAAKFIESGQLEAAQALIPQIRAALAGMGGADVGR